MSMTYNTERISLINPEYGRHVQEMVNHCKTLEAKEERNEFAEAIIEVMGNLNPSLRDIPDFQHKLWDQLFIMAEFDLDVDSPYPTPAKGDFQTKPKAIEYPSENNRFRYYGKNIQKMIDEAVTWEDGEKKDGLIKAIANQMKKSFLLWNKDVVDDNVIFKQLKVMSDGKIDLLEKDINLSSKSKLVPYSPKQHNKPSTYKKRGYRNHRR